MNANVQSSVYSEYPTDGKQTKGLSMNEMNSKCGLYNEILLSYKSNKVLIHATRWMNLENIRRSEINQEVIPSL